MFNFGHPYGDDEDSGRDKNRSFKQSQKNEILYQQGGKCAKCHKQLDPRDIEFDHKKAWADKGRTVTENGRALCGSCHNIVTHGQRLGKAEGKSEKKKPQRDPVDELLGIDISKRGRPSNPADYILGNGPKRKPSKPYNPMDDILGTGRSKKKKGQGGFGPF